MPSLTIYVTNADHARLMAESINAGLSVTRYAGRLLAGALAASAGGSEAMAAILDYLTDNPSSTVEAVSVGAGVPLPVVKNLLKLAKESGKARSTFRSATNPGDPVGFVWEAL